MRIAQIAPIIESVPPEKYGGTERIISALTDELVKKGHDVTLFASGDSKTKAKLFSVYHTSLRKARLDNVYNHNIWSLLNVGIAYQMQNEFDVIHDHNSQNNPVSLPLANIVKKPVIITLHGSIANGASKPYEFYKNPHLVTISKSQAKPAPNLNYIGNVYHGLPMEDYPFSRDHDGYLLCVGRLRLEHGIEEKGLLNAIQIARKVKMPLLIAAKLESSVKADVSYFQKRIKPYLSDKIKWLGEIDENRRNKLMSRAYCMLHPVNFPEPFGLTLIEAMACGCPIVAFNKGSIPEIIKNGKTGYVVNSISEAVKAVKNIPNIIRSFCRQYSLKRFNAKRMADDYELLYEAVLNKDFRRISTSDNKQYPRLFLQNNKTSNSVS